MLSCRHFMSNCSMCFDCKKFSAICDQSYNNHHAYCLLHFELPHQHA
uniref:Uncharacterized protein n=1 Tax=Arundo donax TaxID=35708 RepID=A0A0A9EXC9_ARUDO